MSRQDKATSERHTRTLRELVKAPDNKVCADCKRNDPRWASWNLGVFLCIRCSGIHRSMGTHISKVKSVDLDIWTPEQMDSIQRWGNARANLYWEAHLKPGHIPADHKMESFIRSKYESRRWALEGPPPKDPSVLENAREHYTESTTAPPVVESHPATRSSIDTIPPPSAQRQSHTLLSSQMRSKPSGPTQPQAQPRPTAAPPGPAAPAAPMASAQDDLFSLDFHNPTNTASSASATAPKKDVKNDILSLFGSTPAPALGAGFNTGGQQQVPTQPTSMMGSTGTGMWGVQSGWNGVQTAQPNVWGQQPQVQPQQPFGGLPPQQNTAQSVWSAGGVAGTGPDLFNTPFATTAPQPAKKDDAFGDLWGGFK